MSPVSGAVVIVAGRERLALDDTGRRVKPRLASHTIAQGRPRRRTGSIRILCLSTYYCSTRFSFR
jgi:hypothetical protein